jgi:hypothetical protein
VAPAEHASTDDNEQASGCLSSSSDGGNAHVAAYLAERDLSTFDPFALPRQTAAFFDIVVRAIPRSH